MQHLNAVGAADPPVDRDEAIYQTIVVRTNGSSELQLALNVQELRTVLGLLRHNSVGSGIFSALVPPQSLRITLMTLTTKTFRNIESGLFYKQISCFLTHIVGS